ncbi:peptidyl-prolyl cis-trans isomerase FKBP19, chloroplastic isoform X2 [Hevea brasiliensis]|nr:peptidyl-prolyl cis-trans isomerase FKBP19, chloroplastic isoform X2 [Hevea brasiliensis]
MASISVLRIPPLSAGRASTTTATTTTTTRWRISNAAQPSGFSHSTLCVQRSPMSYTRDIGRREVVILSVGLVSGALWNASIDGVALASEFADMPAIRGKDYGKSKMRYPDYTETDSGLQFKDLRVGDGPKPKMGETVVVDWDGYTIGYYGRIFEARNKTKGGSFEGNEKDFFKFKLGSGEVIPAFEEAVSGMALGGVRRCCNWFSQICNPCNGNIIEDNCAPRTGIS